MTAGLAGAALSLLLVAGCASSRGLPPPATAPHVDLTQYIGTWFQIAAFPTSFQAGCVGARATYAFGDDGAISVLDECRDGALDGPVRSRHGRAWVTDQATNAKLDVQYDWPVPIYQRSWILEVGPGYAFAVIGAPGRDALAIYARGPRLDEATYGAIVARMVAQGYDVSRLVKTPQP